MKKPTLTQQLREAIRESKKEMKYFWEDKGKGDIQEVYYWVKRTLHLYAQALRAEKRKVRELATISVSKEAIKLSKLPIDEAVKKLLYKE